MFTVFTGNADALVRYENNQFFGCAISKWHL